MKIEEEKRRKLALVQKEIAQKLEQEEAMINDKMNEVAQMEMLEMELIKRLQNTQAIQKKAYLELEQALGQPTATMGGGNLKQQYEEN